MTHHELNALYEQRIPRIEPLIRFKARGDKDMEQIARLGVYKRLQAAPDASDNHLKNCAKWAMNDERKHGRSVDNPNHNPSRKFEYEIVEHDDYFDEPLDVFPVNKRVDLETLVINKLSLECFFRELTPDEASYTRYKVNCEMSDSAVMRQTGWTRNHILWMKESIRNKMNQAFAC